MKKYIINKAMNIIKNNTNYGQTKLEEIEYGLISIYLLISKFIFISILCLILGIFKEMIIFTLIYNIIRMPSFGLHATKSWICLLSSSIAFIGLPFICKTITINILLKYILAFIGLVFIGKNSPADTHKKPILSRKRRRNYKIISIVIASVYSLICIYCSNNFISNCLLISLLLQCIIISPLTYKIFKLPYNNYKVYLKKHPELAIE